ncbi:hypothetical protein DL95DRAFT_404513 [Leptodontidium sp. 2 PMI_412]|nr:hypothetical protein DL95DRAFT_404513 [Leptodontidium sp. 2 PMI_412]
MAKCWIRATPNGDVIRKLIKNHWTCGLKLRVHTDGHNRGQINITEVYICNSQVVEEEPMTEYPPGYPNLSALLTNDENLMLYRRFNYIQSRLILYKQDELRELQTELDRMEERDARDNPRLTEATWLTSSRDIMSFDSPRRLRYCGRVKRYFDENDPVSYVEGYIYSQEDILSLKTGREDAWPDAVMPGFLRRCDSKFLRYILSSPLAEKQTDFSTTIGVGVLVIFTSTFSAVLSQFARPKRHELLASAAA